MTELKELKNAEGLDFFIEFLEKLNIKTEKINVDKYGFSREISFKVYDIDYRIVWFVNQSTLYVGNGNRAACLPFKYIYLDMCYPLIGGNRSIGFSYTKFKKESIFDREYPYEVFRIPIEL